MIDFMKMIDASRIVDLKAKTKDDALHELIDVLATSDKVTNRDELSEAIREREQLNSTGIGLNTAIPHVKIPSVRDFVIAIGRAHHSIDYGSTDGEPIYIIIMIAANDKQAGEYLQVLANLVLKLKDRAFRNKVLFASDPEKIRDLFCEKA